MNDKWVKGNIPYKPGWYWVTTNVAGQTKVFEEPMIFRDGEWHLLDGHKFFADNIMAHMEINKPKPYNPNKIGISSSFYIKVIRSDNTVMYYSKQLTPIEWSIVGYSTKEKAIVALRRLKRIEREEGFVGSKYFVVSDDNEIVF